MITRGIDHEFRQAMTFQIRRSQFGMIDAQDRVLDGRKRLGARQGLAVDFRKMFGKCPRHHDLPNVMHQPRHIVRILGRTGNVRRHFPRQQGRTNAMLPEFAPGKLALARQALEIFDHWRNHRQLPDLAHPQVKHRFLNAVHRRGQAEINRIYQPQQPGCQARIAPDDFGNLCGIALFGQEQSLQSLVDAAQRGQGRTAGKLCLYIASA